MLDLQNSGAVAAFLCVDVKRECCWIIKQLHVLKAGESIRFRDRENHLVPSVAFSSLAQVASNAPTVDYLSTLLRLYP